MTKASRAEKAMTIINNLLQSDEDNNTVLLQIAQVVSEYRNPPPNHEPEWLSEALNEGDGVYQP